MSLLAPLYALGALAIGLPILFHLIRRTPRGRTTFSSLMFLAPSPPRITRRSRLEHLLLLLLRATAILLLAIAFARPFFRETAQLGFLRKHDRRIALLVDVSASMQRENLWSQLLRQARTELKDISAGDDVALFAFDDRLQTLVDFDSERTIDVKAHVESIRRQLDTLQPGWAESNLGGALADLADRMDAEADRTQSNALLQIHLFSDMQEGSRLDALQDLQWPTNVYVDVHALANEKGNAGLQEIADLDDSPSGAWRVRLSNDALAKQEAFSLQWLDAEGKSLSAPLMTNIYVPAGQDRVLRLDPPPGRKITGLRVNDPCEFDNTLYLSIPAPRTIRVVYCGDEAADDVRGMRHYLQQALVTDPRRHVEYSAIATADLTASRLLDIDLLVLAAAPSPSAVDSVMQFAKAGGWVVAALKSADQSGVLNTLLGIDQLQVRESALSGYAMLSEIDFHHPLFARLSDARYSDFTKIRFWKMRELVLPDSPTDLQIPARFDNRMPAVIERVIGEGGAWVMASTWSPDDSQLALSTKFVPLVAGWLQAADPLPDVTARLFVGSALAPEPSFNATGPLTLQTPDGNKTQLSLSDLPSHKVSKPGHYTLEQGEIEQDLAVNILPTESRTTPIDPAVLEQFGVRMGKVVRPDEDVKRQRQLRDQELEKRQHVWQWLIATVLAILAAETWIAGRTARRVALENATSATAALAPAKR